MSRLLALLLLAASVATPAMAQSDWPTKPVRIIVPLGAGGSGDTLARLLSEQLSTSLKQQFVVENRPGAGGVIGTQAIAAAEPDGYTIGVTNLSTMSLIPAINPAANYDSAKDFAHIAYMAGAPVVLAANPKTGVKTLADFIAYANKPGQSFSFASSGVGSDGHLMGIAIAQSTKVNAEHVPYKSTGQALTDIVAGHVPFSTFTLSSTAQFLRAGQLSGVAVTSPERMASYPDIASFSELNHPDLVGTTWFALSGPAKMPAAIVTRLNREIVAIMAKPEMQERLKRDGFLSVSMTPAEFKDFVASESARWKPLVESAGLAGKGG